MKKILVLGDTHGNTMEMVRAIDFAHKKGADAIFQVGDFGYWPHAGGARFLKETSKRAKLRSIPVYWVDGNHEDFLELYKNHDRTSKEPVRVRNYIYWMPRGSMLELEGVRILAMGGAASIDRKFRRLGYSWFLEEMISDGDVALAEPADIVLSHDAPINPLDITGRPFVVDADSEFCRQQMRRVVNIAQPSLVLHGHYHMYHNTPVMHRGGYAQVVGLGCDEDPDNMIMLTLDDGNWQLTGVEPYGIIPE